MNKSHIIILLSSFTFIFLVLGITFAILKSNNDEYLKSNPEIKNNDSDTYFGLSITFFVLFLISLCFTVFIFISPKNVDISTPEYKIFNYDTTGSESNDDDNTPYSLKLPSKINKDLKERESKFPKTRIIPVLPDFKL